MTLVSLHLSNIQQCYMSLCRFLLCVRSMCSGNLPLMLLWCRTDTCFVWQSSLSHNLPHVELQMWMASMQRLLTEGVYLCHIYFKSQLSFLCFGLFLLHDFECVDANGIKICQIIQVYVYFIHILLYIYTYILYILIRHIWSSSFLASLSK